MNHTTLRYVLVGCGGAKRDCEIAKAHNLYASAWFRWNRAYALWKGDTMSILSAKGLIPWVETCEPYDLRITRSGFAGDDEPRHPTIEAWANTVKSSLSSQISQFTHRDSIEIVVLHGQAYVNPLRDKLDTLNASYNNVDITIRYPFDNTSGIGEQMQWSRNQVAEERGLDPSELTLNDQFCDRCEGAAKDAEVYPPGRVTNPAQTVATEWWTADGAWLCRSCRAFVDTHTS